jgi:hypothetical protein
MRLEDNATSTREKRKSLNILEEDHLPDLGGNVDGATLLKLNEIGWDGSGSG